MQNFLIDFQQHTFSSARKRNGEKNKYFIERDVKTIQLHLAKLEQRSYLLKHYCKILQL